ncbi:MAG TPA: hypothetical protein VJ725_09635 [Thermoanaerobaculia bacterium]|nr:hypothetical protein [Thermoanaerobaculia bacterium]
MMPGRSAFVLAALLTAAVPGTAGLPAGAPALPSATGKVALEGALTANDITPAVGNVICVYFNVTPLVNVPALELRLQLSPALEPLSGIASLSQTFGSVEQGRTVTLVSRLRVAKSGDQTIRASAQLTEGKDLVQARPFLLTLNPSPAPEPAAERGTSGKGKKLIIYDESLPKAPPPPPTRK